jgi:hypothetical protein
MDIYRNVRREPDTIQGALYYEYMLKYIQELHQTQMRIRDSIL